METENERLLIQLVVKGRFDCIQMYYKDGNIGYKFIAAAL